MKAAFYDFINQFGYLAISALIFLENVFPPIPSELILPLSGFFTTSTDLVLPGVVAAATVGSVTGAFVLYGLGRILSRERLSSFLDTPPMRLLGFKSDDVTHAIGWFDRKGQLTVLVCRCVPVVRSLISIPAGTARMSPVRFSLYTLAGSLVWNTVLCVLGAAAGSAWQSVTAEAEWISDIVKLVILAAVVVVLVWWFVRRILPALRERRTGKTTKGADRDHADA